ncbi:hypothetical protein RCL1_002118 [Eukaryota sp. TZLM3-RCL]
MSILFSLKLIYEVLEKQETELSSSSIMSFSIEHHLPVNNSQELAAALGVDHQILVGQIKSLELQGKVTTELKESITISLTPVGQSIINAGSSPAYRLYLFLDEPKPVSDAQKFLGSDYGKALGSAKYLGWVSVSGTTLSRSSTIDSDLLFTTLQRFSSPLVLVGTSESLKSDLANLESSLAPISFRMLKGSINEVRSKYFSVYPTEKLKENIKVVSEVTMDHLSLSEEELKQIKFKPRNLNCLGKQPEGSGGALQPLMRMRSLFRKIFLSMGFSEMPTHRYVENSFYNFDALFQPQHHPARDAHDTFFLSRPERCSSLPTDYVDRVKLTHEVGGFDSIGWRYEWSLTEAQRNILRTHTTAVSARMLAEIAKNEFKPTKLFSIDRVFRNESVDATHLAEFHQVEGVVAGKNLGLGHLIGIMSEFFNQLGLTNLKFKPTFNPYTEPSMEIFAFHSGLNRWVEIGNSGIFRPEMLRPMGFPDDVTVAAWGLSLERPTMIMLGISKIKDLFGHKVDLSLAHTSPFFRFKSGNR